MKKILTALLLSAAILTNINAQSDMAVGAGLVVSLPMGNFGDAANLGIGGTAAFELKFAPQITGVGHIGYISYGTESEAVSYSTVPLLVGVKYFFQPTGGVYGIGQLGLNFFSTTVEYEGFDFFGSSFGGTSASLSYSEFTLALGAGYEVPISSNFIFDVAGTINIISSFTNIQFRAGVKTGI
ncbi:MAG: outer membrane beta-barrel protein [Ignavibacteriales bacterium]|nr:outer membrane beta-barrel protein [Ignavibacteriales bacterium]